MSAHTPDFIAEAITEAYGERCPDVSEHCPCCKAWAEYDRSQTAFAACEAAEELYQVGLIAAPMSLINRVRDLRRAALTKAQGLSPEREGA